MSEQEIHDICEKYDINNYTINSDGSIDVDGSVYLFNKNLDKLPLSFNKVNGYFDCSFNELTTLEGCPKYVGDNFSCFYNKLTTLEGCPNEVDGNFNCDNNYLKSLKGCPKYVGNRFSCSSNYLTSLEGSTERVGGMFKCSYNNLTSLEEYNGDYDMLICDNKDKLIRKQKMKNILSLYGKHNLIYTDDKQL